MNTNRLHMHAKILIIDDEESNVQLLDTLLKQTGYKNILTTTDPTLAADLCLHYKPDLVLLDLNMPVMDGFEVLKALQCIETKSYVPVMIITAKTDDHSRLKALDLGAMDFLSKPFNMIEVKTRIRNLLEVRLLHKELQSQNEILEQKLHESSRSVRHDQLEIVQLLSQAAEFRDNATGKHTVRVSYYSEIIAHQYGLPHDECELIITASALHDIGILGVPESILLKSDNVTAEEYKCIQTHTTIGAKLLEHATSKILTTARVIALTHHERWDGTGYPYGLSGHDIHLYGRITAIADTFDALTSSRPYRQAWSSDDALEEIERGRGTNFDPELVDIFFQAVPRLLAIREKYADDEPSDDVAYCEHG